MTAKTDKKSINKDEWVWPYDYSISQALYEKIMKEYDEEYKGTDGEHEFINRLEQWIDNKEYPKEFHNNHRVLLKCLIKASRSRRT